MNPTLIILTDVTNHQVDLQELLYNDIVWLRKGGGAEGLGGEDQ